LRSSPGRLTRVFGDRPNSGATVATLAIKRRVLGIQHPFTRICMHHLAAAHDALGETDQATALREELAAWEAALRQQPPGGGQPPDGSE